MTFEEFVAATLPEPHTVTITPCTGHGAYGDVYGTAVDATPVYVEQKRRLVRAPDGSQVVSSTTAYAPLTTVVPDRSRIELPDGRETLVISVATHRAAGLPLPEHIEIVCE